MIINDERQLVTIRKVEDVTKHPNADRLKIVTIGLWKIITTIDLKINDEVLFFEIDSMLPIADERFKFLAGRNEKKIKNISYSRLRTMRLRGELSQGLIIPVSEFKKEIDEFLSSSNELSLQSILKVVKYELPSWMNKKDKNIEIGGSFPSYIPKTNQERIQNSVRQYIDAYSNNETFEASYKLHGSSITISTKDNKLEICSRNYSLKIPNVFEWNDIHNHFIRTAIDSGIVFKLILFHSATKRNIALQGELFGEGINANFENIKGLDINIFDIYDIDEKCYLLPEDRIKLLEEIGVKSIPIYDKCFKLPKNPYDCLKEADGESAYNGKFREGLVFKSNTRDFSFKAVSNRFLEEVD